MQPIRITRWRNNNREKLKLYDRKRKTLDRILAKHLFGITHKERLKKS